MAVEAGRYRPSKWGTEYHNLPYREALGAGAAGPGKSLVLLMDPLYQVTTEHERCSDPEHEHHIPFGASTGWAIHLRRTMPMLLQTIARSHLYFPRMDPGAKYNGDNHMWTFSSGYRYQFGHCKDPNDWEQYFSNEYTWIGFDELVQFEMEQYDQISGRVRSTDPVLRNMLRVRSMSNPLMKIERGSAITVKDPHWVRKRFVEPAPQGRVVLYETVTRKDGSTERLERIYLPATLYDNPDPEFVRQYESTLLAKPPHIRNAMLYGDWFVAPGSFYGDAWNKNAHTCRPFKIPADWPVFRSMDWGYKLPGCIHWLAMDPDGNLFVFREYTFQGKDVGQVAEEVKRIEKQLGLWRGGKSMVTGPADNQLWEERGDIGKSKAAEFEERGIRWVKADKKSRETNAQRLLSRMQDQRGGTPGIVFFHICKEAIATLPAIATDPNYPERPADGGPDHWHDSICYACAFASRGARGIPNLAPPEEDYDDDPWGGEVATARRGRWGYGGM